MGIESFPEGILHGYRGDRLEIARALSGEKGRELFFRRGEAMMASTVRTRPPAPLLRRVPGTISQSRPAR